MIDSALTQSIRLSPGVLLVGAADGRAWLASLGESNLTALPVSPVARERPSLAASLVEGAIYAGLTGTPAAPADRPYTLPQYLRWLAGNYVFAGQTPGLFRRAADRFAAAGRADLAAIARTKAHEEDGHARLASRDLEALGLPAMTVIERIRPPSADAFAAKFREYVASAAPIALFGFSYCMERMALERDAAFIAKVQAVCPPGVDAFRFLRVHSAVGSDSTHVLEQLAHFESLTAAELERVACAAYETAQLLAEQASIDCALTDDVIEDRLRPYRTDSNHRERLRQSA